MLNDLTLESDWPRAVTQGRMIYRHKSNRCSESLMGHKMSMLSVCLTSWSVCLDKRAVVRGGNANIGTHPAPPRLLLQGPRLCTAAAAGSQQHFSSGLQQQPLLWVHQGRLCCVNTQQHGIKAGHVWQEGTKSEASTKGAEASTVWRE